MPVFTDTSTSSPPFLQRTSTRLPLHQVLPTNLEDKKLVAAEPTPLVPIVTRSSSNDVPALTRVQAATGRSILSPEASSKISSCGIPRPLSVTTTTPFLTDTSILLANLKLVRIASSIALSRISSTILDKAGT